MTPMRIGGLASGMDIDQIVGDLMKAERIPLDKLFQNKKRFEWQRDAFREINTKLNTFDRFVFDNFSLSSNFRKSTVTSTNEDLISATTSGSGALTVNSVDQLASSSYGVGTNPLKPAASSTIGVDATVSLSVIQTDGSMKDVSLSFLSTDKVSDVVTKINNSNGGVTAFYDEISGQFSLSAKASGNNTNGAEIIETGGTNFFQTQFGFSSNDLAANGTNAILTVNGATIERTSNSFSLAGFNLNLKGTTTTTVTLSAATDVENMVDKVKGFVEKYNELISGLNSQLKEKKYRDFPPLSDEQRKDMSEKEQELWDEKSKSGILKNDAILRNGLSEIRNSLYGRVDGLGDNIVDTFAEMGITTSSNFTDGGQLVIDESKLRKAIIENPDNVTKTFSNSGEKTAIDDTRGIAQRLRDSLKDLTKNIEKKAGKSTSTDQQYSIGKNLITTEDSIRTFTNRLQDIESRYWRQFTAMEKAISQANQQSAFLMGQFGGGM
ncbi:flagellar hook-associated protein 2 [Paenisporosarcina cavernae]|uniref:Flagellar hook-associated protein 2 n=1 Tax=Paenisporosarcina cavernae TaxID=2320858 RepID=A0A385YQD0_9BACL|nr:flagellar hook-associated protein 2 [Paenisporosarcina cavernae]AYC28959.1 flagellar hook-associated protein 2 [Paenisporosarcina cavernae]